MEQLHFSEYSGLKKKPTQEYVQRQLHDLVVQPLMQNKLSNTQFLQQQQQQQKSDGKVKKNKKDNMKSPDCS